MKAISLWQPWATLIAIGAKEYETRSWSTPYRGPIVIHAAKTKDSLNICSREPFRSVLMASGCSVVDLPFGCAVCVADLIDCIPTYKIAPTLSQQERAFGDYSAGRFAWQLSNARVFKNPVPIRGAQGLFDCFVPLKDLVYP